MKKDFANGFADFLDERLGDALFALREKNEDYRNLSHEYAALLNGQYQSIDEYRRAISRIADIGGKLDDILKRYLLLVGMREHARMEDALSSKSFEKLFTGLK